MKVFLVGIGIVSILIGGYVGYLWITYIDDTITVGSGYGFEIGSDKEEVFVTLKELYADKKISVEYEYNPYDQSQSKFPQLDFVKDRPLFYSKNLWTFYFNHIDNILEFRFENGKLIEIYRHRQFFELP